MASKLSELSEKYKKFVINNHGVVGNIESAFRVISYFAPGRGEHTAVISELLYTASNLLVFLNDAILRQAANIKLKVPLVHKELSTWLTVLEHIEVFLEIATLSLNGEVYRWLIIACIQIAKAAIKFVLLLKYNSGIQQTPPIPPLKRGRFVQKKLQEAEEEIINRALTGQDQYTSVSAELQVEQGSTVQETFKLKGSGRSVRTLDAAPPLHQRNWKVPSATETNMDTITVLSKQQLFGECLHISRPLAHLLSMYTFGRHSWKPWLVACGVDASSLCLMGETHQYSKAESDELRRRTLLMILYLLRSPFYDRYSKERLLFTLKGMAAYIPGVRLIIRPLLDYLPWWQRVYFYVWMT